MSLFRFAISIFANLIMALAGGFLTYLGSVGLVMTLQVYLFLEQLRPGSEVSMKDTIGTANGAQLNLLAEATPWLIMFGELLIGLPLLVFGILGIVRRLQSGFPEEDEDTPETTTGRFGQALVYLAGGVIGLYLMTFAMIDAVDYASLELKGEKAEAVIDKKWKSGGEDGERRGDYYATYRFQTHTGQIFVSKIKVPSFAGGHFGKGNGIIVNYLPGDPNINEWEGTYSLSDFALPLIFYAALVIGGFWGVRRNLFSETQAA